VGLRDLTLKEEYRSDRDDIISEFFVPCLSNCIEYDRCIEYVSVKSLTTLALGFENFVNNQAKMRIITGHRFRASDLDLLTKLMLNNKKEFSFKGSFIRNTKLKILKPNASVVKLFTDTYSMHRSYSIQLLKHGTKNSEIISSLSDLYSSFSVRSRKPILFNVDFLI